MLKRFSIFERECTRCSKARIGLLGVLETAFPTVRSATTHIVITRDMFVEARDFPCWTEAFATRMKSSDETCSSNI